LRLRCPRPPDLLDKDQPPITRAARQHTIMNVPALMPHRIAAVADMVIVHHLRNSSYV